MSCDCEVRRISLTNTELAEALLKRDLHEYKILSYLMDICIAIKEDDDHPEEMSKAVGYAKQVKQISSAESRNDSRFADLYWKSLLLLAPYDFDSYLIYMERDRQAEQRFYLPRRKQLKILVDALQELEDGNIDLLCGSLPPGTGKTTLALFYLTWKAGRDPLKPMLTVSHNNDFLYGAYGECLRMLDPAGEYKWQEVFPTVSVINTNAKAMMIDLGKSKKAVKRFATLEFTSIGSGNAGKVRAQQLLYCDDLTEGIEQALSKPQMDKLWQKYTDDARQRKLGKCPELHIQTRWTVHDVVGRLQRIYGDNPKAKFITVPALNENDESNFDYPIEAGFSTEFYHKQRDIMDDMSWKALYMNQPIEREGLLYPKDSLRRYVALPEGEPDSITGICDTKNKGTDFLFLPCMKQYGNDYYMDDCICSDESDYEVQYQRIADIIVSNRMQMVDFESNNGGDRIGTEVERRLLGRQACGITMHYTTQNKETKIIVNAEWVKKHVLFKDKSLYAPKSDYGRAMSFLMTYTVAGKNDHDDVPDGMAQFASFVRNLVGSKTEIFESPL